MFLVTATLFLNTFKGEFIYDDLEVVINNPEITQWNFWQGWGIMGRFTRSLSLMLDYKIFGDSPYGYHFQNIIWHLSSTILLYILYSRLTKDWVVSLMGALFFASHPLHVESVANISNRKDLLCMFFFLLSFLTYIYFIEHGRKPLWFILSLFAWVLALNSKEVAVVLPLLIMSYELVLLPRDRRWLLKKGTVPILFLAIGAVATLMYVFSVVDLSKIDNIATLGGHRGEVTYFSVFLTSAKAFWYYIRLLLFPFNLSPDYIVELSVSFADLRLFSLWILKLIFIASPFYFLRKNSLIAFGLFWFVINYIPVSNIVPLTYIVADRYMYIPSAGFCLVLAVCCSDLYRKLSSSGKKEKVFSIWILIVSIIAIVVSYSVTTVMYNSVWINGSRLWTHAVKVTPMSYKAHNNLGKIYTRLGDLQRAVKLFNQSLALSPYPKTYVNRGNAFYYAGDYDKAAADYNKAIEIDPLLAEAYYGLGTVDNLLGEYDRALIALKKAVDLKPELVQAYNNLGNVYNKLGNLKQALYNYNKAIDINPVYANAYSNRAYTYMILGDYSLATEDYEKVDELGAGSAAVYYNLGLIYSKIEDNEKSFYFYKKAAKLGDKRAKLKLESFKRAD